MLAVLSNAPRKEREIPRPWSYRGDAVQQLAEQPARDPQFKAQGVADVIAEGRICPTHELSLGTTGLCHCRYCQRPAGNSQGGRRNSSQLANKPTSLRWPRKMRGTDDRTAGGGAPRTDSFGGPYWIIEAAPQRLVPSRGVASDCFTLGGSMAQAIGEEEAIRQFARAFVDLLGAIRSAESERITTEIRRLVIKIREADALPSRTGEEQKPLLLTARQAAKSLSISPGTLWNWTVPRGPIPVVKIGARTCYAVRDLEQAIERMKSK
jgi:hypothetical protein